MRASLGVGRSVAAVGILALVAGIACGRTPTQTGASPGASSGPGASAGISPTPVATTPAPTAADQLAGFFSAAGTADARIKAAATAINGAITADKMVITDAVMASIKAATPAPVAAAIPPGLPAGLFHPVLVVYNDLVSRRAAFNDVWAGTFAVDGSEADDVRRCLAAGAPAAAQYATDLAAAHAAAATVPAFTPAAADTRVAGELAVVTRWIVGSNNGCGGCGGYVLKDVPAITWFAAPSPPVVDSSGLANGRLGDVYFMATYASSQGWEVTLFAC